MWGMTWQALSGRPCSVHGAKVDRLSRVTGVCRAGVPVRRRHAQLVSRHHPRLNVTVGKPASAPLVTTPRFARIPPSCRESFQRMNSVRVPLPRRLLQKHNALPRPGSVFYSGLWSCFNTFNAGPHLTGAVTSTSEAPLTMCLSCSTQFPGLK